MTLHERMERRAVAGRRAGHEVRISRRTETDVHCQDYDGGAVTSVDRFCGRLEVGYWELEVGSWELGLGIPNPNTQLPIPNSQYPTSTLQAVYWEDALVTIYLV
jgi:hypothetical protein